MFYIIANLISRLEDFIDSMAYSWMIYELMGSATLMAILFGVNAIPKMPLGVFIIGDASLVMSIQTTYLMSGLPIGVLFVGQKFNKHLKEI